MKNTKMNWAISFRLFGLIALVAVIGFYMVDCKTEEEEEENSYEKLNGVWDRGDIVVTFNNDSAVFTQINSESNWQTVLNNSGIRIGDKKFRNIKNTGDLKWSCQELVYSLTTYDFTWWEDGTLTLSPNGRVLQSYNPNTNTTTTTYTKK